MAAEVKEVYITRFPGVGARTRNLEFQALFCQLRQSVKLVSLSFLMSKLGIMLTHNIKENL